MKFLNNKQTSKKIIIAILLVMSFNFISPSISRASFGGKLFDPIAQLLCGIADVFIMALQSIFMGDGEINYGGIQEIESDVYYIKYSPGIIFSGKVAGLKVNFIDATEHDKYVGESNLGEWKKQGMTSFSGLSAYGFDKNRATQTNNTTDGEWYNLVPAKNHQVLMWTTNNGTEHYTAVKTTVAMTDDAADGEIDAGYFGEQILKVFLFGRLGSIRSSGGARFYK